MRSAITTAAGLIAVLLSLVWGWMATALLQQAWRIGVDEARCQAQGGCNILGEPARPGAEGALLPVEPTPGWMIGLVVVAVLLGTVLLLSLVAGADLVRGRRWARGASIVMHLVGAAIAALLLWGRIPEGFGPLLLLMLVASITVVVLASVRPSRATAVG